MPLTAFILQMMATPAVKLLRADPDKLAAKYGVRPEHARFYLENWTAR